MDKKILEEIFHNIKLLMEIYEPSFKSRGVSKLRFELWSDKEVEIADRKMNGIYFAGLMIRSNYIGFYYMPIYAEPGMKKLFKPEFLILLKGKSCFHVKENDKIILKQIEYALKIGSIAYKERGWV